MDNTEINELIIELAKLNDKLNSESEVSNVKLVLAGIEDDRDPLIDLIIFDRDVYHFNKKKYEYVYDFYQKQIKDMNKYYKTYGSDICFEDIVEKIMRILLKKFKLFSDTKSPKGYLIDYCFKQEFGSFKNRIWAYFHRYIDRFEEMKGHKSIEQRMEYEKNDYFDMEDYLESNKFYMQYRESAINSKDKRGNKGRKINMDSNNEAMDIAGLLEEGDKLWCDEEDVLVADERKPTIKNVVITNYNVNYETLRMDSKYIVLTDKEYNEIIEKMREHKSKKWNIYRSELGFFPHDISKYKIGFNTFGLRNKKNKKNNILSNKNPEYIEAFCKKKKFDFNYLFFDKKPETYLKNTIIRKLAKRQKILIGYLYYEMLPVDEIIALMKYDNKTALNKVKHEALKILRLQILNDYEFIQNEYGETFLWYWTKHIIKHNNKKTKNEKKVLSK